MRCGYAIESCGSERFQSALTATNSTTSVSQFAGSVQASRSSKFTVRIHEVLSCRIGKEEFVLYHPFYYQAAETMTHPDHGLGRGGLPGMICRIHLLRQQNGSNLIFSSIRSDQKWGALPKMISLPRPSILIIERTTFPEFSLHLVSMQPSVLKT
jgi:hypothetical protein